jgi:Zn-dependent alcohol dehydrogenase
VKTRGAVLTGVGRPLEIVDLELDPPGPGELLVRVHATGLCHSDLSVIDGSRIRPLPMVLGHEAAGEVVEAGPNAEFAPGDHVVLSFVPACGACRRCASGRQALCEPGAVANREGTLLSGHRRWTLPDGTRPHHHLGVSGFAEYTVISDRSATLVPADLPFDIAALFGCAVLTGAGAAFYSAQVVPGDTVAAVTAGATQVVAVDVVEHKRQLALTLGATHETAGGPDVVSHVRDLTSGGADKVIDTTGVAAVLEQAYAATGVGGTTVTVGLPHPDRTVTLPALNLVAEERTLKGSYLGSCVPRRDVPRFVDLYRAGRLPVDGLLSGRLGLAEINDGFARLASGEAVRQVVVMV